VSIDDPGELAALEAAGSGHVHMARDGWTVRTDDGSPSAHAEHTIVVTERAPVLVTA